MIRAKRQNPNFVVYVSTYLVNVDKGVGPFTVCLVEEIVLCSMKIHDVEEEMSENQGSIYIYREGEIFYSKNFTHTYDLIINIDKFKKF